MINVSYWSYLKCSLLIKMILCKIKLRYRLSYEYLHFLGPDARIKRLFGCLFVKKLQSCNKVSHIRQKYLHYLCLVMWNKDFCYCNNKSWHWLSYMFLFFYLFCSDLRIVFESYSNTLEYCSCLKKYETILK